MIICMSNGLTRNYGRYLRVCIRKLKSRYSMGILLSQKMVELEYRGSRVSRYVGEMVLWMIG